MKNTNSFYASLYVGDLHENVDELVLFETFRPVGEIISIRVCRDSTSGKSLHYAYVNFRNEKDAIFAIENLNLQKILGIPCRIMWSQNGFHIKRCNTANIFISNLEQSITAIQIYDTFVHFGDIISCKLQTDKNQMSKGVAFVQYKHEEDAAKAIEVINGKLIKNQIVFVGKFVPRTETNAEDENFTNCFIKNFGMHLNDESLKGLFVPFGEVISAKVMVDDKGESKGFGFVSFKNHNGAVEAIDKLNGKLVNENRIYVGRAIKAITTTKEEKLNQNKMNVETNLYVKNLDENISKEQLKQIFSLFGNVKSAVIMVDDKEKKSKGFGFVSFTTHEEANQAQFEMNGKVVEGKPLYVNFAQSKEHRIISMCHFVDKKMNRTRMTKQNPLLS